MMFGYVNFLINGDDYTRFYNKITEHKLPCTKLKVNNGALSFGISVEYSGQVKAICEELSLNYEIAEKRGFFTLFIRAKKHLGIIFGVAFIVVICLILSNILLRIRILSDNSTIKKDILAVLKENNISAGSYIPNLKLVQLERELKQKVDGISWAGISKSGSTLIIDIVENISAPDKTKKRLPSDIISKHDAVIDKIEVFDGQLVTTVGSAVLKGETLVSGLVINEKVRYKDGKEVIESHNRYVRSLAKIYGTFDETITIFQPYIEKVKCISDENITKKYIRVFDTDIPLFISFPKGEYSAESDINNLSIFGFDFPVGLKKVNLNEITFQNTNLTENQATQKAYDKLENYEKNFCEDYKIIDKKVSKKIRKNGVELSVTYKLYGDICEEHEFFIEK